MVQPQIPAPSPRRFVTRDEFAVMSRDAATFDIDAFRADQAAATDQEEAIPPDRWDGR